MMMTAAGTIAPARLVVLGAGVAGLQAIATARRLGAVVSALNVRRAAKEQVESLGARVIEVDEAIDAETKAGYAREMDETCRKKQEIQACRSPERSKTSPFAPRSFPGARRRGSLPSPWSRI